jgi:exopolysaccharide biosynthesis polyprenyl glycosylphosphotransferase
VIPPAVRRHPTPLVRHRPRIVGAHHHSGAPPAPDGDVSQVPRATSAPRKRAWRSWVLIGGDLVALVISGAFTTGQLLSHLVVGASTMVCLARLDRYRFRWTISLLDDLPSLMFACLAGIVTGVAVFEDRSLHPVGPLVVDVLVAVGSLVVVRGVVYVAERRRRRRRPGRATLILGTGKISRRLGRAMLDYPEYGLRLVGYLDDERRRREPPPVPLLGHTRELARWIEELGVGTVVVTFGAARVASLIDVVRTCDRLRCDILMVPRLFELHSATGCTEYVHGLPVVRLRRAPFRRLSWRVKRVVDVIFSALAMILLAPLFVGCALAVRLEGGPGVLFRQVRVGIDGRHFEIFKFRTMAPASPLESTQRWTIAGDRRVGPVGRLLRATSLDELPQLVNVLRGDMSLVGPRPERPYFVEQLSQEHPRYRARHRVPVGMTGWAAIHGLRGDTSISDRVEFDNAYIQNWSIWLDAKIMLRTLQAVLGRSGG